MHVSKGIDRKAADLQCVLKINASLARKTATNNVAIAAHKHSSGRIYNKLTSSMWHFMRSLVLYIHLSKYGSFV